MQKKPAALTGARIFRTAIGTVTISTLITIMSTSGAASELPPYATSEVLDRPTIFGTGIISTELPEFASAFSPDGDMVFFNRMPADRSRIEMLVSRFENGSWTAAELLPFSGTYRDVDPWISNDGSRLYFSSNRPVDAGQPAGNYDTWYVESVGSGWSEPARLGPEINTDATEIFVSMTDGGTLYFRRSSDETRGIYRAQAVDDGFSTAQEIVGLDLESAGNPMIGRDGSFLILSGIVEGRASDLFISFADGDGWTPAKNMGPSVNTIFAEFAPGISPDGKYLFFTSERPGVVSETNEGRPPGDIYQIELDSIEGISWPD